VTLTDAAAQVGTDDVDQRLPRLGARFGAAVVFLSSRGSAAAQLSAGQRFRK